jgi:hypothetical protein
LSQVSSIAVAGPDGVGVTVGTPGVGVGSRARKALDSWEVGLERSVAIAIETAYFDGITHAATFADEHGEKELAGMIRTLSNGTPKQ